MIGEFEKLLIGQYGTPQQCSYEGLAGYQWNGSNEQRECRLLKGLTWNAGLRERYGALEPLYGDAHGGMLLGGMLKIALVAAPTVFGLYSIEELQCQPEVLRASAMRSQVCFFMDSANVWYYGIEDGDLYVYDAEAQELDLLGPTHEALNRLLEEREGFI